MVEGKAASTVKRILDNESEFKDGKLGSPGPFAQPPKCPECSGSRIWKDGLRYVKSETGQLPIQRFLCRTCGFRFSETTDKRVVEQDVLGQLSGSIDAMNKLTEPLVGNRNPALKKTLNKPSLSSGEDVCSQVESRIPTVGKDLYTFHSNSRNRQVCVSEREMKNLSHQRTRVKKRAAGATKPDPATTKGLIAQYAYWLENEGYTSSEYINLVKRLARLGANLLDPEDVKRTIAQQPWKNGTKMLAVYAFDGMAKMLNMEWSPPKYVQEENLPFVPEEGELDQLIAGCRSRRMATFLQTLKETFADPGEVLRLRWIDVSGNIITINDPVKRHNPRQLKVSNKLITMLNALPRTSERIFLTTYDSMWSCFARVRKRVARILQNPRINAISFNTFRHWGATMTYHYTKNLLLVQKILGHKSIKNTVKYTHLVHFKDDEFDVATATTVEEAKELAATGFDYFTRMNGIQIFRKPKMFQKYRY